MNFTQYQTLNLSGLQMQKEVLRAYCLDQMDSLIDEWEEEIYNFILDWTSPEPHVTAFTSGSTGTPQAIQLDKNSMLASALITGKYLNLQPGDRALLCLPCRYIAGKMMLVRAFALGLNISWLPPARYPFAHPTPMDRIDFCAMTPLQVQATIAEEAVELNTIKHLIIGGAPLMLETERHLQRYTCNSYITYGMTETVSHIAMRKLHDPENPHFFEVLDPDQIKLGQTADGCLKIRASYIDEEITTRDIVEFDDFTRFKLLGRKDNIINSGGIKVNPESIEETLAEIFQGKRFFIGASPDKELGETVTLIVEGKPFSAHTVSVLAEHCRDVLPQYHNPRKIGFCSAFVETETGKIQRKKSLENLTDLIDLS